MNARPGEALVAALRAGRVDFNQRFEAARHQFPQLDGAAVLEFLRQNVEAAADAVWRVNDGAVMPFVSAAYDAVLLLCGQKLAGVTGRYAAIGQGWRSILPAAANVLARDPVRVVAAISNALHTLATTPGARADHWIRSMSRLAPQCPDSAMLMRLGELLAWNSGLAHLRAGALASSRALPPELAAAALGLPDAARLAEVHSRLGRDPWFDPGAAQTTAGARVAREVGAFRGLGGLFLLPPRVAAGDGGWLVQSGDEHWFLMVDVFGATFHRATPAEWGAARAGSELPRGFALAGSTLQQGSERLALPLAGPVTSIAASADTLALSSSHTFAITFVALPA